MLSMAFFSMVMRNGKTCRLMTSTKPPKQKNPSDHLPVNGKSCWNRPRFCMNRIQPIEAMYGGVMKGIMNTMSSHLWRASCVRASRNAVGSAITLESSTTHRPSRSELRMVLTLRASAIVARA